jgi:hypothetical protein
MAKTTLWSSFYGFASNLNLLQRALKGAIGER